MKLFQPDCVAWSSSQLSGNEIFTQPNWEQQRWETDDRSLMRPNLASPLWHQQNEKRHRGESLRRPDVHEHPYCYGSIQGLFLGHSSQVMERTCYLNTDSLHVFLPCAADCWWFGSVAVCVWVLFLLWMSYIIITSVVCMLIQNQQSPDLKCSSISLGLFIFTHSKHFFILFLSYLCFVGDGLPQPCKWPRTSSYFHDANMEGCDVDAVLRFMERRARAGPVVPDSTSRLTLPVHTLSRGCNSCYTPAAPSWSCLLQASML